MWGSNMYNTADTKATDWFNNWVGNKTAEVMRKETPFNKLLKGSNATYLDGAGVKTNVSSMRAYLDGLLKGGIPDLDKSKRLSRGEINKSYDNSLDDIKATLASNGTLGSGISTSAIINLLGKRSTALADSEMKHNLSNVDYKNKVIAQLMGLDQLDASMLNSDRSYQSGLLELQENKRQFDEQLKFQKDQADTDIWGSVLGAVGGTLLGGLTGGVGTALGGAITKWLS